MVRSSSSIGKDKITTFAVIIIVMSQDYSIIASIKYELVAHILTIHNTLEIINYYKIDRNHKRKSELENF